MKNLRKSKLIVLLLAVALLFATSLGTVTASAPSNIKVKRIEVLSDLVTNHDHGFTIFTTTDGKIVYCMDNLKTRLDTGMSASLIGTADAGVQYILENGYPNKKIMDNGEADKYITQAAIWWYMEETNQGANKLSDEFKNANKTDIYKLVPTYIKPMVANAKKAKNNNTKPSMKVNANNQLYVTSDGKYYETNYMSAELTKASTYKVTVTNGTKGTKVVDKNGNTKNTFASKEQFKVIIPISELEKQTNINVNLEATGSYTSAKVYSTGNDSYQRVVGLFNDETTLKNSIKLTASPRYTCEIIDGTYYGKNGTVVDKKTYNKQCKKTCEFIDGTYYGKDGDIVDKKTFNKQCKKTCEVIDGTYYGKDGDIVDKKTFNKQCGKTCVVIEGTYYGKDGNIVDEKTFNKQCNKTCEIIDGTYYGKNGTVVDKKTYNKQCSKSCAVIDGVYYGKAGDMVDKATYDAECGGAVVVPNTNANISPLMVTLGLLSIVSGSGIIAYRTKKSY